MNTTITQGEEVEVKEDEEEEEVDNKTTLNTNQRFQRRISQTSLNKGKQKENCMKQGLRVDPQN